MNTINATMALINGGFTLASNTGNIINNLPDKLFHQDTTRDINHKLNRELNFSKEQLDKIFSSGSNRVPVIIRQSNSSRLPCLDKNKFLINPDMLLSEFKYIIQRRLNLRFSQALFLFIDFELVNNTISIGELYNRKKSQDNVLYLTYCEENVFGYTIYYY